MKKLEDVFDLVKLQAWIDQSHKDLTRATGDEYLSEDGTSREISSTIVPESVGWHQPSSVCEIFGIEPEELCEDVEYELDIDLGDFIYRSALTGKMVIAEEFIDTLEYNYEQIEHMVDEEYTEPIREKLNLYDGSFSIGWFNGEFCMLYWINVEEVE